jgi:4-amino-4-deoxy-L-arabinose transferase-like glycosyltransferase
VTAALDAIPTNLDARPARSIGVRQRVNVQVVALGGILLIAALLRFPLLDRVPNGLFLDEASRGYDAFALVRTGADQYGSPWPIFSEGLDDYTPALFTYLVVPSVAALGLTEAAVRLPSALAGTATVGFTYLAARAYFSPLVGLVGAAILAISPWHILPSRTGAEWVLLPAFTTLGSWLLRRGLDRPTLLPIAGLVLGLGLYSYAFARLFIPLLVAGFAVCFWPTLRRHARWSLLGASIVAALAIPLAMFSLSAAGQARLAAVVPVNRLDLSALLPYVASNYLSYFDPAFLIWGSEPTHHHRLAGFGPVLLFMVPLCLLGIAEIVRRHGPADLFWLWWLVAAPAASALHRESPSSALLLGAIPSWQVVAALGWSAIAGWDRAPTGLRRGLMAAIVVAGVATAALAARALYLDYPSDAARDWEFGAREAVEFLEARRSAYDRVLVSDRLDTPHILVLFHASFDPRTYQAAPIHVRQPNVRSRGAIGQYQFGRVEDLLTTPGRHLVWVGGQERIATLERNAPALVVRFPDGVPAHRIFEVTVP